MRPLYLARLRELRAASGITQARVARALDVTQRTYSDYESGRIRLCSRQLVRLSVLYGVSIDYLCGITDDPQAYPVPHSS